GPCYTRRKVLPMSPNARHPCLRSKHPQGEREPETPSAKQVIATPAVLPSAQCLRSIAKCFDQLVDRGVGIVAYLRRAGSALERCQVGIELGGPGAAFLDQPGAVLGRKRLVRRAAEHGTALAELADPPGQDDRVVGPFLEPLAGGIGKSIEVDARSQIVSQCAWSTPAPAGGRDGGRSLVPPAPSLDQEDSQHNGRRRGEGRDPAGQGSDPARGRGDGE